MDTERFSLDKGRERPPYKPKDIHCPGCGAGLTVKDERSELVVCEYCGSHLDISREEKTVLGKGPEKKWEFPLQLGDSFRRKKTRYEIIARMAFIEDGDMDELTRQYLLYNPYRGTLWLDEYQGQYSISSDTHVMPTSDPFSKQEGDVLKTHDNIKWVMEEKGTYELAYVDGALPWLAREGDRILYVEFSEKSGSPLQYDVQRVANEIEYGSGEALPIQYVREATGKPDLGGKATLKKPAGVAQTQKRRTHLLVIALVALLINAGLTWFCMSRGKLALDQQFSTSQLSNKIYSAPFKITGPNELIKVVANADVAKGGIDLNISVAKGGDPVSQVKESGKSINPYDKLDWTYIKIPQAGTYRLQLYAPPATSKAEQNVGIRVFTGAMMPHFFFMGSLFALLLFLIYVFASKAGKWLLVLLFLSIFILPFSWDPLTRYVWPLFEMLFKLKW